MENRIDKNTIEKIYNDLDSQKRQEYLNKFKKRTEIFLAITIILTIVLIGVTAFSLYELICYDLPIYIFLIFMVCLMFFIDFYFLIIPIAKDRKLDNENKIKKYIKILELKKQTAIERKNVFNIKQTNIFDTSNIKSVILIDSYTEYSDKLHAVLNYQEIIQTRYYKFKVTYLNGCIKIITAKEDSKEYNALITFLENSSESPAQTIDNADLIKKYKQLFDEGIITQEEFDKKKTELLK